MIRLVSGPLVAADVHADFFLEWVDAQPVKVLQNEAERAEDACGPPEDKEYCTELNSKQSEVPTSSPPFIEPVDKIEGRMSGIPANKRMR